MPPQQVVVIGAGVIGLQTAITLLQAGHEVNVIAQYFPGDEHESYTSPWAGAHWRTHASKEETEACDWDTQTYHAWKHLLAEEKRAGKAGESGIYYVPAVQYWDQVVEEIEGGIDSVWWASVVDDAKQIPKEELPAGSILGMTYSTFTIDVPKFLAHLVNQVVGLGGKLHRVTLPIDQGLSTAVEAAGKEAGMNGPFVAINATGIGAKKLTGDDLLGVVQGQTVLVRGEARGAICRLGPGVLDVHVIIPRPGSGTTIVGSSRDPGNWKVEIKEEITQHLLEQGKRLAPELLDENGEFEVIAPYSGLRPYRKGGARVERERLSDGQLVIHAYGHGGAGYQNSIGSANKVLRLLNESNVCCLNESNVC